MEYDRPLSAEALAIMRHATVADLRSDAAELVAFVAGLDDLQRAKFLFLMFGSDYDDRL